MYHRYQDISTQVNFDDDNYQSIIKELKEKNKKLEEVTYNTRYNGGKEVSMTDEIMKDELLSLRNEFKKMVLINQKLRQEHSDGNNCCFCCVIV
jgi:hypothetical protein